MKKKIMSIALVILLMFTLCSTAFAADASDSSAIWVLKRSDSGEEYLYNRVTGEIIIQAFGYNDDGELVELDLKEHLKTKNPAAGIQPTLQPTNSNVIMRDPSYSSSYYDYRESNYRRMLGNTIKVSADVDGPGSISYLITNTISHSYGGSVSITASILSAIQSGVSFDWNTSLSTSVSAGYSFDVPAGRRGYVQFTPYVDYSIGSLYLVSVAPFYQEETMVGQVWYTSPVKLANGIADGVYELVLR